jgi:hypothetical protein
VSIGLEGYDEGGANCVLCDHDINWLYVLHLVLVDGQTATFAPVGSSCIRTWADSLPHSEAQQAILAALKLAEDEAERVKASFREFNRQATSGDVTNEDRDALVRYLSSPPAVRQNPFLADVARKVERYSGWASDPQRKAWLGALNRELLKAGRPALATVPTSEGTFSREDADLLGRAKAILAAPILLGRLKPEERDALQDIAAKVERYGSFRSTAQRGYFASIIKRAEGSGRSTTQQPTGHIEGARPIGGRVVAPVAPAPRPTYDGDDLPL